MTSERTDLLVVGAGPAGLAAAATALAGGLSVAVVGAGHAPGGQFWRHPPAGHALGDLGRLHHDLTTYRALLGALERGRAAGRARLLLEHHAWTAEAGPGGVLLHVLDRTGGPGHERAQVLSADRLLIATGAHDRPLPFPGWDLPGVLTVGALQALLKGGGVRAGSRVAIGGTGPFLLPVATALAASGAQVVAVCEANRPTRWLPHLRAVAGLPGKLAEGGEYAAGLARHRVPVRVGTAVVAAQGAGRVERVTLARVTPDGTVRPGTEEVVAVDAVGTGWGFQPQLDLAVTLGCALADGPDGSPVVAVDAGQRTSVDRVLVAGEACGVGGAELALREGQLAAESVLADLGLAGATPPRRLAQVRRHVARLRRFAAAMADAHPVPSHWDRWLGPDTLVCRCEEVTAGRVAEAVAAGAADARQVKQLTRAGMGWCQGRMCAGAVSHLAGAGGPSAVERLVAGPVPLGALAARTGEPSAM